MNPQIPLDTPCNLEQKNNNAGKIIISDIKIYHKSIKEKNYLILAQKDQWNKIEYTNISTCNC